MTQAIAIRDADERSLTLSSAALTIQDLIEQKKVIAQCMKELMKVNEHYGVIPGTGQRKDADGKDLPPKPSLLKPGADLIGFMFRLDADYINEEVIHDPGYIYYRVKCVLTHIPTGKRVGSGVGSCNSREERFHRAAPKKCPRCGKETIFRSKPRNKDEERNPDKLGWYCWAKKSGCGANFQADDETITGQDSGIKDPSDLDNSILKMALKRARVDAILTATAASDFFTQDVEDLEGKAAEYIPPQKEGSDPKAQPAPSNQSTQAPTGQSSATFAAPRPESVATAASKRPRADQIKHDGKMASHKQVTLLHIVAAKIWERCDGNCAKEVTETKKWGKEKAAVVKCGYHTKLSRFKDQKGEPITTSTALSSDQISFFIDWCEKTINSKETAATREVDLDAIPKGGTSSPRSQTSGNDSSTGTTTATSAAHPGAMATANHVEIDTLDTIRNAISEKESDGDESLEMDILSLYGVNKLSELAPQHHPGALALACAWKTGSYLQLRQKIASQL